MYRNKPSKQKGVNLEGLGGWTSKFSHPVRCSESCWRGSSTSERAISWTKPPCRLELTGSDPLHFFELLLFLNCVHYFIFFGFEVNLPLWRVIHYILQFEQSVFNLDQLWFSHAFDFLSPSFCGITQGRRGWVAGRVTGILYLARRSKYHLSIWPLSRGVLIPRLDGFFFLLSQFLLQVLSRSFAPLPPFWSLRLFFFTLVEGYFLLCQGLLLSYHLIFYQT